MSLTNRDILLERSKRERAEFARKTKEAYDKRLGKWTVCTECQHPAGWHPIAGGKLESMGCLECSCGLNYEQVNAQTDAGGPRPPDAR